MFYLRDINELVFVCLHIVCGRSNEEYCSHITEIYHSNLILEIEWKNVMVTYYKRVSITRMHSRGTVNAVI